jgi:hypothetical protein
MFALIMYLDILYWSIVFVGYALKLNALKLQQLVHMQRVVYICIHSSNRFIWYDAFAHHCFNKSLYICTGVLFVCVFTNYDRDTDWPVIYENHMSSVFASRIWCLYYSWASPGNMFGFETLYTYMYIFILRDIHIITHYTHSISFNARLQCFLGSSML